MSADFSPELIYGTAWKEQATTDLVVAAVVYGFRAIDTANQAKHYQEPLVGEALRRLEDSGIARDDLFLQSKFTSLSGQNSRIPYDPHAALGSQVRQSFDSSLEHLGTDYLDSYLLHGPYNYPDLGPEDFEVWEAITALYREGRARMIGVSNVNSAQLQLLLERSEVPPMVVQNRCYAIHGWDQAVRKLCREHGIIYQGFSLLTANPSVVGSRLVSDLSQQYQKTAAQIIYRFAVDLGMTVLTGTTNPRHMEEALAVRDFKLSQEEVGRLEQAA